MFQTTPRLRRARKWEKFLQDFMGKKVSSWTIVSYKGRDKHRQHIVECRCDCGQLRVIPIFRFTTGTNSLICRTCSLKIQGSKYYLRDDSSSIYTRPMPMHASEEEDIIDYYTNINDRYYRDDNN